jgi:hypothetical protein
VAGLSRETSQDSTAVSQVAGGQDARDGLQFFGTAKTDHLAVDLATHSVVRLAVVPLSGGIVGSCALLPQRVFRGAETLAKALNKKGLLKLGIGAGSPRD